MKILATVAILFFTMSLAYLNMRVADISHHIDTISHERDVAVKKAILLQAEVDHLKASNMALRTIIDKVKNNNELCLR